MSELKNKERQLRDPASECLPASFHAPAKRRTGFRVAWVAVLVFGLMACMSQPPKTSSTQTEESLVAQATGSISSLTAKPRRTLTYTGDEQFNRQLSASMRAEISPIKIELAQPFDIEAVPTELDRWYFEIDQTKGQVISCPAEETRMRSFLLQLAIWAAGIAWDRLQEEWLFAPAKSYNAVNYVEADRRTVRRIEFIRRDKTPPC